MLSEEYQAGRVELKHRMQAERGAQKNAPSSSNDERQRLFVSLTAAYFSAFTLSIVGNITLRDLNV